MAPPSSASAEVQEAPGGRAVVKLRGQLDVQSTAVCWRELERKLAGKQITTLEVDASEVTLTGGIGAALLRYLSAGAMTPGAQITLRGVSREAETILSTFTVEDFHQYRPQPSSPRISVPAEVGAFVRTLGHDFLEQITFLGSVVAAVPAALARPKRMRWREVRRVMETAGANALPIVAVVSALVGLVTVLEAAHPLAKFGAQIFLADMVGFASIRDTGPMVTAILLAGRSSSAFAAELGTMKVNRELDALVTMGLDPVRFLVVQRLVAAFLLTPLLTLYAMLMGIIGGLVVMRFLGFPPLMIYHQILGRVSLGDVVVGLSKAAIFGLIVGGVGCLRGLQTGKGPSAVGVSTTRSVITAILLIILANTLYSTVQYFLS